MPPVSGKVKWRPFSSSALAPKLLNQWPQPTAESEAGNDGYVGGGGQPSYTLPDGSIPKTGLELPSGYALDPDICYQPRRARWDRASDHPHQHRSISASRAHAAAGPGLLSFRQNALNP